MDEDTYVVTIPFPPSVNHYWSLIPMGNSARMIVGKKGRLFRQQIKEIIGKMQCKYKRLAVRIEVYPPDKRRRDLDNMLKATLDALQHAGVYQDDFQIDDLRITRTNELDTKGRLVVYIKEI